MTPSESESYRRQLLAMSERISRELEALNEEARQSSGGEASGGLSDVPLHPADLGSRETEENVSLGLVCQEEQFLGEIDAALERLQNGTFGLCETRLAPIEKDRLDAVPYTRNCIDCAP